MSELPEYVSDVVEEAAYAVGIFETRWHVIKRELSDRLPAMYRHYLSPPNMRPIVEMWEEVTGTKIVLSP